VRRWFPLSHLPLRLRLTLWYLLTLALILIVSGLTLYWQTQRSLLSQIDASLQVTAVQAQINVDVENGRLAFQNAENLPAFSNRLREDIAIFLLDVNGNVWDKLGRDEDINAFAPAAGFRTYGNGEDAWRIFGEPITDPERRINGWIQVTQSLEPTFETLATLRLQLLWGLPLAMLFTGVGGYFLASRALNPIDRITRTVQVIGANDLSQRIAYSGPADEVGRLAATFNHMLERLQIAFERERRFTGDAAHELRTPLAALKGRIEVTLTQPRQPATYVATLQDMEEQVDRLIRLSSGLLYIARLDQGQIYPHHETIDLADLLDVVVDQVCPLAESKTISITDTIPPGLRVRGDQDMLIRLFLNLLDNAVKHSLPGGHVILQAEQDKARLTITVSDSGPGIPAEHLPHLFERFYRVESARSRGWDDNERGGAGLGLAIAYEIANAHGGALTVQSIVGQGTTFTVHLPQNVEFDT
jgi:heavy metal sensor kinase